MTMIGWWLSVAVLAVVVATGTACAKRGAASTVRIDGSSTVYPILEAMAEKFAKDRPEVRVVVGTSGTGGGFKKFCAGETDINSASRPIKPSEVELCKKGGVEYVELPIAYDGIAVVVNPRNDWVQHLTVEELGRMWAPEAKDTVKKWSDVRPGWPDRELRLFGPGIDSGTYDYFTEAVVGKEGASRGDYTSSEDDNVLVQHVAKDENALGVFGFAYYYENRDKLRAVPIDDGRADNGDGPIALSLETVRNGTYQPLSRPLFIYVAVKALDRREVLDFVTFVLSKENVPLVSEVGYVPLPEAAYPLAMERVRTRRTGSLFQEKGSQVGVTIDRLLEQGAR